MTKLTGVKITSILLILYCTIQLAFVSSLASFKVDALIISLIFLGSILPLFGLISGIGLLGMRTWARDKVILFSKICLVFYGCGIPLSCVLEGSSNRSVITAIFLLGYFLSLPIWCLYYLSKPRILLLLKESVNNS